MKKKCNFVFMLIDFKIMYKLGGFELSKQIE